jgi:hypothetical protein
VTDDSNNGLRDQFVRQRRFLVSISVILVSKFVLAIEVGNSLQFLGAAFEIKRPEAIVTGLWIAWAWALVRYCQYFWHISGPIVSRAKSEETHRAAFKMIARDLEKQIRHPGIERDGVRIEGQVIDVLVPIPELTKPAQHGWEKDQVAEYFEDENGTRSYRAIQAVIKSRKSGKKLIHTFSPSVDAKELRRAAFWGWLRYLWRRPYFSEYYAPLLIAAGPPAVMFLNYGFELINKLVA